MAKVFSHKRKTGGYTLIELLFYITFFVTFSMLVIDAMLVMSRSLKETAVKGELSQSGVMMERMSREIRQAYGVNSISATDLKLDTTGTDTTIEFALSGYNVQLTENGLFTGNLNAPNIAVTALSFTEITTAKSKAVKISLSLHSTDDASASVQNFYDTIVLRGSYQ